VIIQVLNDMYLVASSIAIPMYTGILLSTYSTRSYRTPNRDPGR
jgi:hypothetical protein